jgi:hypothetical protein
MLLISEANWEPESKKLRSEERSEEKDVVVGNCWLWDAPGV